jgi:hypothetical protein
MVSPLLVLDHAAAWGLVTPHDARRGSTFPGSAEHHAPSARWGRGARGARRVVGGYFPVLRIRKVPSLLLTLV